MNNAIALSLPSPTADLGGYLQAIQQFPMLSQEDEQRLAGEFREQESLEAAWELVFLVHALREQGGVGTAWCDHCKSMIPTAAL